MSRTVALALVLVAACAVALPAQPSLDGVVRQIRQEGCAGAVSALDQLASGADLEARRASYLNGWCLSRLGRYANAVNAFRAAASHPSLRPYARVEEGVALVRSGKASEAAALLRAASTSTVPLHLRARALIALGDAERALTHPGQAVLALQIAVQLRPDDPAVWLQLGGAAEAAGQKILVRRAYARAGWAFPGDPVEPRAREALNKTLGRTADAGDIDAESHLLRGRRLAQQGAWDQAEGEYRAAEAEARSGPIAGEAWYRLGEIYLYSNTPAANSAFTRAAALGWNPAGSWFWVASTAARLGRTALAREATVRLMRVAPSGFWAGRFWLNRGLRAESDGRSADAAAAYRRASAAAPDSDDGAEARWRLGWIALRGGRLDDAEARFRTAGRTATGRSDAARAWYWVAKTIEARTGPSGEGEAAAIIRMVADQYPLTFYGQRARARVGTPSPTLPFSPLPVIARGAPAPAYEELARLGIDAEAAAAAEDALSDPNRAHAGRDPRVVDFLAETYGRLGEVQQSVAYAEEAIATGRRDAAMWRLAYPKAFWPQVKAAAQAENINPLFLLALVREESRYDAAAISPARAVGLAQLLPSTARAMTGDPSIGVLQLQNPQTNLRLGARYIRLQMDRFAGDLRLTLAAYNAGPGAARRWMNLDADPDYFIEKIGYAETRAYIRRVMGSYGIYTLLW